MQQVQVLEITLLELDHTTLVKLSYCLACQEDSQAIAQVLTEHLHVDLVVEKFALLLRTFLVRKLPSAHCISDRDISGTKQVVGTAHDNM